MSYLVAAYAVFWAISFGLVFSIVLRQRRLQAELHLLRQVVDKEPEPEYGQERLGFQSHS